MSEEQWVPKPGTLCAHILAELSATEDAMYARDIARRLVDGVGSVAQGCFRLAAHGLVDSAQTKNGPRVYRITLKGLSL